MRCLRYIYPFACPIYPPPYMPPHLPNRPACPIYNTAHPPLPARPNPTPHYRPTCGNYPMRTPHDYGCQTDVPRRPACCWWWEALLRAGPLLPCRLADVPLGYPRTPAPPAPHPHHHYSPVLEPHWNSQCGPLRWVTRLTLPDVGPGAVVIVPYTLPVVGRRVPRDGHLTRTPPPTQPLPPTPFALFPFTTLPRAARTTLPRLRHPTHTRTFTPHRHHRGHRYLTRTTARLPHATTPRTQHLPLPAWQARALYARAPAANNAISGSIFPHYATRPTTYPPHDATCLHLHAPRTFALPPLLRAPPAPHTRLDITTSILLDLRSTRCLYSDMRGIHFSYIVCSRQAWYG